MASLNKRASRAHSPEPGFNALLDRLGFARPLRSRRQIDPVIPDLEERVDMWLLSRVFWFEECLDDPEVTPSRVRSAIITRIEDGVLAQPDMLEEHGLDGLVALAGSTIGAEAAARRLVRTLAAEEPAEHQMTLRLDFLRCFLRREGKGNLFAPKAMASAKAAAPRSTPQPRSRKPAET